MKRQLRPAAVTMNKHYCGDSHWLPSSIGFDRKIGESGLDDAGQVALNDEVDKAVRKIETRVNELFGSTEAVLPFVDGSGIRRYRIRCPVQSCDYSGSRIARHLRSDHHKWCKKSSTLFQSCVIRTYRYVTRFKKDGHTKPSVCKECSMAVERMDQHLVSTHNVAKGTTEYQSKLRNLSEDPFSHLKQLCGVVESPSDVVSTTSMRPVQPACSSNQSNDVGQTRCNVTSNQLLQRAKSLNEELKTRWVLLRSSIESKTAVEQSVIGRGRDTRCVVNSVKHSFCFLDGEYHRSRS